MTGSPAPLADCAAQHSAPGLTILHGIDPAETAR
jgi:hypothetical protein